MLATYPVPPLLEGHPLAIGVTSYDGHVYYGLTADRDMLPDADLLGPCLQEALDELVDSARGTRARVPRGRKRRQPPEESS
jgi:diacylglycerol O-acyltransferase